MLVKAFAQRMLERACPPDHEYKLALYTTLLDAENTTEYSPLYEWEGLGYEAGGKTLSGYSTEGGTLRFDKVEWLNADISARCGLIYDATTGEAIKVMDFKRTVGVMYGLFEVFMPDEGIACVSTSEEIITD